MNTKVKKIAFSLLSSMLISGISFNSYAEENSSNTSYTITREDFQSVVTKVISLDINAEKGDKTYIIKALGTVHNRTNLYLKNIQIKVKIMDTKRNIIDEIQTETIDGLEPNQEKAFKIEKIVNANVEPYDVRAQSELVSLEGANTYQMATWYAQGKKDNLVFWNVPVEDSYFQNDSWLRNQAINLLLTIDKYDKDYDKSLDMLNELRYNEALVAIAANDFTGGLNYLTAMNLTKKYGDRAEKLIDIYRSRVLYEKAKPLINSKKYIEAIPLLRSIPTGSEYYDLAQTDLKNIYFYFRHRSMWTKLPEMKGSDDQKSILKLMETKPEKILNDTPSKNMTTWIFPDYSRFNFDQDGRLISYKVYPLY
ncbi:MAG: hypothetical protein U0354_10765 [Candidatus Sericytochromatia bacterium]